MLLKMSIFNLIYMLNLCINNFKLILFFNTSKIIWEKYIFVYDTNVRITLWNIYGKNLLKILI